MYIYTKGTFGGVTISKQHIAKFPSEFESHSVSHL